MLLTFEVEIATSPLEYSEISIKCTLSIKHTLWDFFPNQKINIHKRGHENFRSLVPMSFLTVRECRRNGPFVFVLIFLRLSSALH